MHVVYITALTPYGAGESFILPEVRALRRLGVDVTLVPIRPTRRLVSESEPDGHVYLPLFGLRTWELAIRELLAHPLRTLAMLRRILAHSGHLHLLLKNLAVFPKGLATASLVRKLQPDHIHAHWASTPSTVAYVAASQTDVPWSFTAHRWDITENNMIAEKARSATMIRAISRSGQDGLRALLRPEDRDRLRVIHMGVEVPAGIPSLERQPGRSPVFACPANLVEIKGHAYLIDACRILRDRGRSFDCWLIGDGPLEGVLRAQIEAAGLEECVHLKGRIPHHELLAHYGRGTVDVVVLPSIRTDSKVPEEEGIPVALMEAMSAGIPVISTNTGGIPELLAAGAGLLVEPARSESLAEALESLLDQEERRISQRNQGFERIRAEFSLEMVSEELQRAFSKDPGDPERAGSASTSF